MKCECEGCFGFAEHSYVLAVFSDCHAQQICNFSNGCSNRQLTATRQYDNKVPVSYRLHCEVAVKLITRN